MLAQLICLIMVSGGSAYIGYQVGLWARDEVRKYGSLRNTMKYTVIEWVIDWALVTDKSMLYDYLAEVFQLDYEIGKSRRRAVRDGQKIKFFPENMTDYEKKLHNSIYSEELPF